MLFTKATEYALLSLIYMATKGNAVDVDTISNELEIPKSFLAKILQNMAKDQILNSYKGANGGFVLAKEPSQLSLKDIIESAEKRTTSVFECSNSREDCPSSKGEFCKIWNIFNSLQIRVDEFLDTITLQDILAGQD